MLMYASDKHILFDTYVCCISKVNVTDEYLSYLTK